MLARPAWVLKAVLAPCFADIQAILDSVDFKGYNEVIQANPPFFPYMIFLVTVL